MSAYLLTLLAIWLLQLPHGAYSTTQWCNPKLCDNGQKHILCRDNGNMHRKCPKGARIIEITPKIRNKILEAHNEARDRVAGGIKKLPLAARMAELEWDNELALVANAAVRQCKLLKLECANTEDYRFAGENEALEKFRCKVEPETLAEKHIDLWYNQRKDVKPDDVANGPQSDKDISLFLQLMRDKANRVGCAISRYVVGDYMHQLMKCVYSCGIRVCHKENPVYLISKSKPADKCKAGKNSHYKKLCSEYEAMEQCNLPEPGPIKPTGKPTNQKPANKPEGDPRPPYKAPPIPYNPIFPGPGPVYPTPSPPPYYSPPPPWTQPSPITPPYWEKSGARSLRTRPRPRPRPRNDRSGSDYDFISDYLLPGDPCDKCVTISCRLNFFCI